MRDLIARQTQAGEIAFNPPETMELDQAERIEVRIQPYRVNTESMVGPGPVRTETIGVTAVMSVKLCCGAPAEDHPFDIVAQSSEQQLVTTGEFTSWVFEVIPRKSGMQVLTLSVAARYRFSDGEVIPKDYPVKTKQVQVLVSDEDSFDILIVTGIAVVLVVLLLGILWLRRRNGAARIFVSYRRDDSGGWVRGLHDRLAEHFGDRQVFMDLQDIKPGFDFVTALHRSLKETRVVLVIIGRRWLENEATNGSRRLDDPKDWVRLEVAAAISSGKRVIPVLVDGADMPAANQLPGELQALCRFQAVKLHPDQFSSGVQVLIEAIDADYD